jgi:hypothetical protein
LRDEECLEIFPVVMGEIASASLGDRSGEGLGVIDVPEDQLCHQAPRPS